MLNHVSCVACEKPATEAGLLVTVGDNPICCNCADVAARKFGLLPERPVIRVADGLQVDDKLPLTFSYRRELSGHLDQKFDVFLLFCLMDLLRAHAWNLAIELARLTRTDGFVREKAADGATCYRVELLVRSRDRVAPDMIQDLLDDCWENLAAINTRLLEDKGLRDLLEPRLASLAAYVIGLAQRAPKDWPSELEAG